MRAALALVLVAGFFAVGAIALGRAIDTEVQDRIVFTRGGMTLDCERRVYRAGETIRYEDGSTTVAREGEVGYVNCNKVP